MKRSLFPCTNSCNGVAAGDRSVLASRSRRACLEEHFRRASVTSFAGTGPGETRPPRPPARSIPLVCTVPARTGAIRCTGYGRAFLDMRAHGRGDSEQVTAMLSAPTDPPVMDMKPRPRFSGSRNPGITIPSTGIRRRPLRRDPGSALTMMSTCSPARVTASSEAAIDTA